MTTKLPGLFLAISLALSAQSLPKGLTAGPTVEGITEYKADNGLRILLFPDNSKPTVTVNVASLVGSKHEDYGETGMAHLLEHMLFKGTPTSGNIMNALKDRGADFNGTTDLDRTNYFETLQSSDDNLRWALQMEADRMVNSKVARPDLDTEMTVVRNEYEAGENEPMNALIQRTLAAAYEWHNYGKSTIGNRADIENVPIERLQAFYHKYYQPDNAMLVVAGKFDRSKALNWIAEYLGAVPKPARVLPRMYTEEPTQDGEHSVTVRRTGDVQAVLGAYHIPAGTHPDFAAISVLREVLGNNPSGRLYKAMVDNKKASTTFGFELQQADPGLLMFGAQVPKADSLQAARELMLVTISGVIKEPPTKEEVERAKTRLLKQIDLNLANSERIGIELSEWASMRDWRMLFINRDRLKKVEPDDVLRAARSYLKESNLTLGLFIPTGKPDRSEIKPAPDMTAELNAYKGTAPAVAQGEIFDPSPRNIESRLQRGRLSSGPKLVMLSKKTRGETVQAVIHLRFGDEPSLQGKSFAAQAAARMLMRGTKNKNRQQIQDALDQLKARMQVSGDATGVRVSIETIHANLPAVLRLAAEVLREPSFPESEFEPVQRAAITGIEQQKTEPMALAMNELQRHIHRYPQGDPRATYTFDEQVQMLKDVTLAGARAFYDGFYGASNGEIAVAGDFNTAEVQQLVDSLFAGWKSPKPYQRLTHKYQAIDAIRKVIDTPDKSNAVFFAGAPVKLNDADADYPGVTFANYLFGGSVGSRLMERLRQKEGWSYGTESWVTSGSGREEDGGAVFAMAILNPLNMDKLENGFKEEVDKVAKDGFRADEVEKARKAWLQEQVIARSQDQMLAYTLANNEFLGRTMAYQEKLEADATSMSAADLSNVFRKYFSLEKLSIVRAGDFSKNKPAGAAPNGSH